MFGIVLRKLIIDGIEYYQSIDKFEGNRIDEKSVIVSEGIYEGMTLESIDDANGSLVYVEISKEDYENVNIEYPIYFEQKDTLEEIKDPFLLANIVSSFYKKYQDFPIMPNYKIDDLIKKARNNIKRNCLGQDVAIKKILYKILNNNMAINSDIDKNSLDQLKSNILVMGPYGVGKTTIKNSLMTSLDPIPVVEISLTGDYSTDIKTIIRKLITNADGNMFLAVLGIVVYDNINMDNSSYDENSDMVPKNVYIEELKRIMASTTITTIGEDNIMRNFDMSRLTHLCFLDMPYTDSKKDGIYYTKVHSDDFMLFGIEPDFLDYFDGEIIYMQEMNSKLAKKILLDKIISPLNNIKMMYEKMDKKVTFTEDFVDHLIEVGLSFEMGFEGIIKILKYLNQSSKLLEKNICFKKEDIDALKIGSMLYSDYDKEENYYKEDNALKVDLINRTINGLTVKDTVNLIKENIEGQDEAIFTLVNAFYNHVFNKNKSFNSFDLKQLKENVLFIGSTGVGKTAIVENLTRIFNITYVREIATRYSQTGYVGSSVDDMLLDLVKAAKGDMQKAQNGILYIDEIDKINKKDGQGLDMGLSVQNDLLTLIEGDKRNVEAKEQGRANILFDTSGLFIIATGAFDGLDEIVKRRVKKQLTNGNTLGFTTNTNPVDVNYNITNNDLYEYGYDKQFIARFSNKVKLNNLSEEVIFNIINNSRNGYINLCRDSYQKSGITLKISDSFKKKLASKVLKQEEGARGIKSLFSPIKQAIDYNLQDGDIGEIILDEEALDDPKKIMYIKKKNI